MKNLTYINVIILLVMSIWTNAALAIPSITATASAGTTIKFTATLSEKLLSGYKVKIDYGNGKGLVAMTCSSTTCTLSSNSLPVGVNSASYKIGVYNAQGILQGTTTDGVYAITYSVPINNISNTTFTAYNKISNTGVILPDSALLGTKENDWACTKDNKTGLVWEIKTDDNGLRDKDWYYSYFDSTATLTGVYSGTQNNGFCQGSDCDTSAYKNAVNKQNLCGASNWRVPSNEELKALILCSDGKYNLTPNTAGNICSSKQISNTALINATYFPNTQAFPFWSSSPYVGISNKVLWGIDFGSGYTDYLNGSQYYVRLVHEDQTVTDYLNLQKASADKVAFDYLSALKTTADKTTSDYLNAQKAAADKTAADYLATLKAAADSSTKTPGTSSTAYVKISNTGATLPDSAKLGTGANDWACTKDKATGLIWEVKTTDDGLRDLIKIYTLESANSFVIAVNKLTLCGSNTWRLPSISELKTLLSSSSNTKPFINNFYFPNTQSSAYRTNYPVPCIGFCVSEAYYSLNFGVANLPNEVTGNSQYSSIRLVHS
jgi:hypothetical protein